MKEEQYEKSLISKILMSNSIICFLMSCRMFMIMTLEYCLSYKSFGPLHCVCFICSEGGLKRAGAVVKEVEETEGLV